MITGTISIADYLHAQRLHRKSIAKWAYIAGTAIAACGVVMLVVGSTNYGLIALCASLGSFIGEGVSSRFLLPRRVAKLQAL